MQLETYVVIALVPAVTAALLAWDALRMRGLPVGKPAAALLAAAATWTAGYAGELAARSLNDKILWAKLQYLGIAGVPLAWFAFACAYTGRSASWRRGRIPLLLFSLVTLTLAWSNESHGLIWSLVTLQRAGDITMLGLSHGAWFFLHVGFSYVLLALGTWRIAASFANRPLFGGQVAALTVAALAPWLCNLLYVTHLNPLAPLDLTPFAFAISGIAVSVAVHGFHLLDLVPVAHASVLASMKDGVVVLDEHDRVLDVNPAGLQLLGLLDSPRIGTEIRSFLPELQSAVDGGCEITRPEGAGGRVLSVNVLPLQETPALRAGQLVVISDVTTQRESANRIHDLAYSDSLTGLPNREVFRDRFAHALAVAERDNRKVACLFIDLDHFKRINDHYGHSVGDEVLRVAATRIAGALRGVDTVVRPGTEATATLARFGGDEFVILLEGLRKPEDAVVPAERIVAELQIPYRHGESLLSLNASLGVAIYPIDGRDSETLLGHADAAMYAAKEAGGSRVQFFTQRIREAVRQRIETETQLHRAIEEESFTLLYQPQVSARDGRIVGFEALLRWKHPERGLVTPDNFVAVAEESGLIVPLGDWVIRRACSDWATLLGEADVSCKLALNLSPRQFSAPHLVNKLRSTLLETEFDPQMLELELTEGALMEDTASSHQLLEELRRLGVRLSIDDFGCGYSSLSYMRTFALDAIKIDRSFTDGVLDDSRSANLVKAIIAMSRNLGLDVVCEGVEQAEQAAFLRAAGCDRMQGYFYGRPMDLARAEDALLEARRRLRVASA